MAKRDNNLIKEKIQAIMAREGYDALLITKPDSIYYSTGIASSFMFGGAAPGTVMAVIPKTGKITMVITEFETSSARVDNPDVEFAAYPIFVYVADFDSAGRVKEVQPDPNKTFKMAADVINEKCPNAKKIGVERGALPYDRMLGLMDIFGADKLADCSQVLIESATTKTPWEINVLRNNAKVSHEVLHYIAKNTEPGMSERDITFLNNKGMVELAGKDFTSIINYHVIGEQFSPFALPREEVKVKEGDMIRLDGGVRGELYTSDLARTYAVGNTVCDEKRKIWEILHETSEALIGMIGPGVRFCDAFKFAEDKIKGVIDGYNRGHFGHSIGCNCFGEEYPMINRISTDTFQVGSVFCVETPYYSSFNNSYNIEDTILITENGIERFTKSNEEIFWK